MKSTVRIVHDDFGTRFEVTNGTTQLRFSRFHAAIAAGNSLAEASRLAGDPWTERLQERRKRFRRKQAA